MKALPWLIVGVGAGLIMFFMLNQPGPAYATGNDDIEEAAEKTGFWGSKQRLGGSGREFVGKLKQGVGRVTGYDQLAAEGIGDQVIGTVQDATGQAAHAVGQTIHDLNR